MSRQSPKRGGHGVVVTQGFVVPLSRVQFPLVTPVGVFYFSKSALAGFFVLCYNLHIKILAQSFNYMKHFFILCTALIFLAGCGQTTDKPITIPATHVPNVSVETLDGETKTLHQYLDKPLIINSWATWCTFCKKELPDFADIQVLFSNDIDVIAINRGESNTIVNNYITEANLQNKLTFLQNKDDTFYKQINGFAMPETLFVNTDGTIHFHKRGFMSIEEIQDQANELLAANRTTKKQEPTTPKEQTRETNGIKITNGQKHSIPLEKILSGGPPKDGIPSIDNAQFESITKANNNVDDNDTGIAVSFNGIQRFYPYNILVWHEIVNDNVGGQPTLVTYCPLCGTGIVFEPIVNGQAVAFGTSGKLYQSNLIMYDRLTDSYWSQVLGEAVVGEQTGTKLNLLPYDVITYGNWKTEHPNGQVLSRKTGSLRNYDKTPYGDYDDNRALFFPVDNQDDRFHPKAPTFGIEVNNKNKIYPIEELEKGPAIFTDKVDNTNITINYNTQNKTVRITNDNTKEDIVPVYGFWFSWISVHPNSDVYIANQ